MKLHSDAPTHLVLGSEKNPACRIQWQGKEEYCSFSQSLQAFASRFIDKAKHQCKMDQVHIVQSTLILYNFKMITVMKTVQIPSRSKD